jgi:hypothetical protein
VDFKPIVATIFALEKIPQDVVWWFVFSTSSSFLGGSNYSEAPRAHSQNQPAKLSVASSKLSVLLICVGVALFRAILIIKKSASYMQA